MLPKILVCLGFPLVLVKCSLLLGEPGGLYSNGNAEYASSYNNYKPRDYQFEYGVSDPHTGDHKSQWEVKENGVVKGAYSLLEPDGTTRVVEYIADDHGFRAVVKKLGTAIHPEPPAISLLPKIPPTIATYPEVETAPQFVETNGISSIEGEPYYGSYNGAVENYVDAKIENPWDKQIYSYDTLTQPLLDPIPLSALHTPQFYNLPLQEFETIKKPQIDSISTIPKAQIWISPIIINKNAQYGNVPNAIFNNIEGKILHPHGESSSNYFGVTGNLEDDSKYTNYDDNDNEAGVEWNSRPYSYYRDW